jgi:hypothetical protein
MAVREVRFSRASHKQLAVDTVKDTVQYVCVTFWENGYPNPSIYNYGQPAFIQQQEFRSFKNTDTEEKHQKSNAHFSHQQAHPPRKHQTQMSHWWANNCPNFLCHALLWIPQGGKTQTTKNQDPQAEERQFLSRSQTTWPRQQWAWICGLRCYHIRTTEEGWEDNGYSDPNGITRHLPMPSEGSCSNHEKDQEIPRPILSQWMDTSNRLRPHTW